MCYLTTLSGDFIYIYSHTHTHTLLVTIDLCFVFKGMVFQCYHRGREYTQFNLPYAEAQTDIT